jgi:hypothetical protein
MKKSKKPDKLNHKKQKNHYKMKTFFITTIAFLAISIGCKAQWNTSAGIITTTNNVGIGNLTPANILDIQQSTNGDASVSIANANSGASGRAVLIAYNGTSALALYSVGTGYTSTGEFVPNWGVLRASLASPGLSISSANSSGAINFFIGQSEKARFTSNGNFGIGTINPDAKLAVKGTIHSTSVLVDTNVPTPDYVFNKGYNLPSLAEIKTYTDKNHHLPGVPAAAEIEKNGLNLGEMNMVLLKKVEELTLYLIEKDKQLQEQKKINKGVKQQLIAIKSQQKLIDEMKISLDKLNHKKTK